MHASELTELRPDLVVARYEDVQGARKLTKPPLLVVEVQSPSTAMFDLNTKKVVYERLGIASYWIVVPDPDAPELIVYELSGGRYEQVAHVTGKEAFRAERPFPVEVIPARLVAGLFPGLTSRVDPGGPVRRRVRSGSSCSAGRPGRGRARCPRP